MTNFKQPISVFFVWHPADNEKLELPIEHCYKSLQRDSNKPFSRAINLPVFYRTSDNKNVPSPIDIQSKQAIIFVLISSYIVVDDEWIKYINELPRSKDVFIIPIALDKSALNLRGSLKGSNCIRAYEFEPAFFKENLLIAITHEIYRRCLNEHFDETKTGKENAIKIFISHAKDGKQGIKIAKGLKDFIDNSTMRNFFDATDIAPSYLFDKEVFDHIKDSTIIAIHSDPYSSRFWCQKEIILAKDQDRPIVAIDCLEEFEDRRFPYAANIPGVHVHLNNLEKIDTKDIFRVLTSTLLETVRFHYSKIILNNFQALGFISSEAFILSRPPEARDINKTIKLKPDGSLCCEQKELIYPEPPVYDDELEIFKHIGINSYTPINYHLASLSSYKIGISISDISVTNLIAIGQQPSHLIQLSQDLARHLLAKEATLIYGGDLRDNGFTDFLFKEASALQARLASVQIQLKNYLAWPLYVEQSPDVINWKATYHNIAKMLNIDPPSDVKDMIVAPDKFLPPSNTQNSYVWSRCLTTMREEMIDDCNIRICAGGKTSGYKGKMPGVLEEILIAVKKQKPIFLIGGFGGVSSCVCKFIESGSMPQELTESWQIENNAGYKDLIEFNARSLGIDYDSIKQLNMRVLLNGLSDEENKRLFNSPFVDEVLYLILKGLKELNNKELNKIEVGKKDIDDQSQSKSLESRKAGKKLKD